MRASSSPAIEARDQGTGLSQVNLTLRFPHISSWQINHLRHNCLEESARMAQS
ncbi:hypothetical protein GGR75_003879, partial [Xanthomonas campestris]|nr:hypothetical protein [Xanthomonas campestris]